MGTGKHRNKTKHLLVVMKILSVVLWPPKQDAAWVRILRITEILERDHTVHFICYRRNAAKNYPIKVIPDFGIHIDYIDSSPLTVHVKHLRRLLKEDYDVVLANVSSATAFCCLLGKITDTPLIFDMHGSVADESLLYHSSFSSQVLLNRFTELLDLKYSDKVFCVSHAMMNYLIAHKGIPSHKLVYVPNGAEGRLFDPVDKEKIDVLRRRFELNGKFVFGYIGEFQRWQGAENLIEAARTISDIDVKFLIVGGDERREERNISFVPRIPPSEVSYYYALCNVLVLPRPYSKATEFAAPTKFAEYAAAGKPILTTNVGDAARLVDKYNCGVVVKDSSIGSLTRGITYLKNESKEELKRLGENSKEMAVKELNWDVIAGQILQALESLSPSR
jgi:glycosyltransferase involved in cell wall biosynthesis